MTVSQLELSPEALDFAREVMAPPATGRLRLRQGKVTAVALGSCTVLLAGSTVPIPGVKNAVGYRPDVNDTVWILQNGPDLLVIGSSSATNGPNTSAWGYRSDHWMRVLTSGEGWYNQADLVGVYTTPGMVNTYPDRTPFTSGIATIYNPNGQWLQLSVAVANSDPQISGSRGCALIFALDGHLYANDNIRSVWRNFAAAAFVVSSRRDQKNEIRPTRYGLEDLLKLEPVDYRYKPEHDAREPEGTGLIAEDTVDIYPPAVTWGDPPGDIESEITGIDYAQFTPLLIKSVQQLTARVAELEAKLAELVPGSEGVN